MATVSPRDCGLAGRYDTMVVDLECLSHKLGFSLCDLDEGKSSSTKNIMGLLSSSSSSSCCGFRNLFRESIVRQTTRKRPLLLLLTDSSAVTLLDVQHTFQSQIIQRPKEPKTKVRNEMSILVCERELLLARKGTYSYHFQLKQLVFACRLIPKTISLRRR